MPARDPWVVHKFGGSSVADGACFARVADIVEQRSLERRAIVLSACRGVTDDLYALVSCAEQQGDVAVRLGALRERHVGIAAELLSAEGAARYADGLDNDLRDVAGVLHTVQLTRSAATNVRDLITGYGEIWSSRLLEHLLNERGKGVARWLDARQVLFVEWGLLGPAVDWPRSREALAASGAADHDGVIVITGFIASDKIGAQTTLGRNGSDFSASIFGALFKAKEICIWTDVDGVLSADPRRVPDATVIDVLSYNEAMELAYFGAKVLHPQTMSPAIDAAIPIRILNTFAPHKPGTLICAEPKAAQPVKGITSIERVAMIDIEGAGMIGVPGTAHRFFGALREASVSVILITQGSSEHTICCAVPADQADRAASVTRETFERELRTGQIQDVAIDRDLSILAVVGDGMAGMPGVAASLFGALSRANVNVRAIAQGSSERNISVVIAESDATRALRAAHAGFYLSPNTLSIGVIGPGSVGRVLLDLLVSQRDRLREQFNLDLRLRGVAASKQMSLFEGGPALESWREEMDAHPEPADLAAFTAHICAEHLPHSVIIDCSASEDVARLYADFLARGVHVVTANKKAQSAEYAYYHKMQEARRGSGAHYLYEATVGAGLPIIQTARDLRETGDDILSIDGTFSGTLAYLFNRYDGSTPFSDIVREARQLGYTEPDPRDDLSGLDVARKLVILGREMGLALELGDVQIESLAPAALRNVTVDEFMQRFADHDDVMKQRYEAARARCKVLRHVGRVTAEGEARVGVVEIDETAPLANTAHTDNIVRFTTRRYRANPMIVQGPGAGPDVTAGGVFADVLRLASYLGARM